MHTKPYLISGIIGNSRMLATLDHRGELHRLWWPNIDYPQNLYTFMAGIRIPSGIRWFQEDGWQHQQYYEEGLPILVTTGIDGEYGVQVSCTDFVLLDRNLLVRNYQLTNLTEHNLQHDFVCFSSWQIGNTTNHNAVMFLPDEEIMLHYRHGSYIGVASDQPVTALQCAGAMEALNNKYLNGLNVAMAGDAAMSWEQRSLPPGQGQEFNLYIAAGHSQQEVISMIREARQAKVAQLKSTIQQYWKDFWLNCKAINATNEKIQDLYRKSQWVFALLSDGEGGGIVAAPEFDEYFTRCGGYGYCWGRDGAYITVAMEKAGLSHLAEKFFRWAMQAQSSDGSWQQRHYVNGELAPTWGLQIDETGSILWGVWQHYRSTGNRAFLEEMYPHVQKGVDFLLSFIDEENGLPGSCYDLWEERKGQHTYSAAAVAGGLQGAASIAKLMGDNQYAQLWNDKASAILEAIKKNCWSEDSQRLVRTINKELPHHEYIALKHSGIKVKTGAGANGTNIYQLAEDHTVDVSLLGLVVPFDLIAIDNPKMVATVKAIEEHLTCHQVGGIRRYEHDGYVGGNPWVLTTLWLALYYVRSNQLDRAKQLLLWSTDHCTSLGLLPEQVDQHHGGPAWVVPLTWSHAMFVLVVEELLDSGVTL